MQSLRKVFTKQNLIFIAFHIAWAAIALIGSQFLIGIPMGVILGHAAEKPFWIFIYYLLYYALALFFILVLPRLLAGLRLFRATRRDLGISKPPTIVDLGLAPVGYIVYLLLANLITILMQFLPWFDADQQQDIGFSRFLEMPDRLFVILATVFIAPVVEELVMRGWLYGKLRSKLSGIAGIVTASLLVSLLFGALHGQWNVAAATFGLSLILCTLREITGTIWSGMLLHILVNGIAFYLVYVIGLA